MIRRIPHVPRTICLLSLLAASLGVANAGRPGLEDVDTPEILESEIEARLDWAVFGKHAADSSIELDTSAYDQIFDRFSDHGPKAALDFLHLSKRGIGSLSKLVQALEQVPVSSLNRDEQLAYWLNLHNAQGILQTARAYPVADQNSKIVVLGPAWTDPSVTVEGYALSLRDIEHRIILRQWRDARVLYGIYTPASGTPAGPTEAFRGKDVWRQLEARARTFVNHGPSYQIVRGQLHVSALYYLAESVFPGGDTEVLAHVRQFASPEVTHQLAGFSSIEATWLNWRLNSFSSGYDVNQDRMGGGS